MKALLRLILAFSFIVFSQASFGETKKVKSMREVLEIFEQFKGEILGVFDIDMVLIQTTMPAYQMPNMKKYKTLFKELLQPLTPLEKDLTLNLTINSAPIMLVDSHTPRIINEIFKITPKIITLTGSLSGSLGTIPDMTRLRYEQLKSVGLDFSKSFPELQTLKFTKISPYRGNHPEYYHGIFSANGDKKGLALVEFLKTTNYMPKTIIFIDDQEKNIVNVSSALKRFNRKIHFVGIIYKGAENFPAKVISENTFKKAWTLKIKQAKLLGSDI